MLLSGEPGIGKSRIAARRAGAPRRRAAHAPALLLLAAPPGDSALHPFIRQLEHAAGFERDDAAERKLDKLEALLAVEPGMSPRDAATPGRAAVDPERRPLPAALGPQPAEAQGGDPGGPAGAARRAGGAPAGADGLRGRALDRPDLAGAAGADRSTACTSLPVLLIVTARPEFAPPWTGPSARDGASAQPAEPPRRRGADRAGDGRQGAAARRSWSRSSPRTDGVPLFVEELTKTILESGALRGEGDRYVLTAPLPSLPSRRRCMPR